MRKRPSFDRQPPWKCSHYSHSAVPPVSLSKRVLTSERCWVDILGLKAFDVCTHPGCSKFAYQCLFPWSLCQGMAHPTSRLSRDFQCVGKTVIRNWLKATNSFLTSYPTTIKMVICPWIKFPFLRTCTCTKTGRSVRAEMLKHPEEKHSAISKPINSIIMLKLCGIQKIFTFILGVSKKKFRAISSRFLL